MITMSLPGQTHFPDYDPLGDTVTFSVTDVITDAAWLITTGVAGTDVPAVVA